MRHTLEVVRLSVEDFFDRLHFQKTVAATIGLQAGLVVGLIIT